MSGQLRNQYDPNRWRTVEKRIRPWPVSPLEKALVEKDGRIIVSYLPEAQNIIERPQHPSGDEHQNPLQSRSNEQLHAIMHSIAEEFIESQVVRSLRIPMRALLLAD